MKRLISLIIFLIVLLIIIILKSNGNFSGNFNVEIDLLKKNNDSLQNLLNISSKFREKDRDSIKLLKQEKIILINHLNYKLNEIKYIKIKNNKIPDDSIFIILKQKYNEDSINNIK